MWGKSGAIHKVMDSAAMDTLYQPGEGGGWPSTSTTAPP